MIATKDATTKVAACVGLAAVATPFLVVFGLLCAFSICGYTGFIERVFPYAIALDPSLTSRPLIALGLAVVQLPLYGYAIGQLWARFGLKHPMSLLGCGALVLLHMIAVSIAHNRVEARWEAGSVQSRDESLLLRNLTSGCNGAAPLGLV